jgi:hypothetical protein
VLPKRPESREDKSVEGKKEGRKSRQNKKNSTIKLRSRQQVPLKLHNLTE